jgi:phosphoribosyl 1,2-cyclic phosphodiesterase
MRFCVLASGSSGNASLLKAGNFGVLLDLGLGPQTLARRLADVGASWDDVSAALLTHVHGDHWNENTLAHLERRNIPLYCHHSHATALKYESPAFADLLENDRLCFYELDTEFTLAEGIGCRPLPLKHDGGVTCGFRFEGQYPFGQAWALAYAADLGSWDAALADALANVDVLALEFNHDETMERQCGRAESLIRRVLGELGHLSNNQAAELLTEVLARSTTGRLQHLVQLHLSGQCNRPDLARTAVDKVLRDHRHTLKVHTAEQACSGSWLALGPVRSGGKNRKNARVALTPQQPWLPGWDA